MTDNNNKSTIPTSCTQTESTILMASLEKVWSLFRGFAWEKIAPEQIQSTVYETGGQEGMVGSIVKITYKDGTIWSIRITEISERNHTVAYELLTSEPAHNVSGVEGEFKFLPVTYPPNPSATYVSWMTEFSNDADLTVIADQKYKKQEFFKECQKATI